MAVTDLHTLDISEPIDKMFSTGATIPGAVLSLVQDTPQINVGDNSPLVISGRAKGALVHEGGAKPDNGRVVVPKPFTTAKLIYSQRVTDEFMQWDGNRQGDYVSRLVNDWVTKSVPRDIDTIVIHGVNPATGSVDTGLSDYIRKAGSSIAVPSTGNTPTTIDTDFNTAILALSSQNVTGIALSANAGQKLSTIVTGGVKKYPELGVFGLTGGAFAGKQAATSPEVGEFGSTDLVLGDWSQLLLGFAGQAEWKTIEFGDPDNTGVDLQGHNQVCIRLELKFGFRVLDATAFAVVAGTDS
jgi:hypothetical protein